MIKTAFQKHSWDITGCFSDDKNCFSETQLRHHRMCLIGLRCHTSGTRSSPDYLCVRPSFYQSQGIIKWACHFLSPALGHLHPEEVHLPLWQCLHHLVVIRTARSVKRKVLILISERHMFLVFWFFPIPIQWYVHSQGAEVVLVTFFAAPDSEQLLLQDVTSLQPEEHLRFLAVHTPCYLILRKHTRKQVRKCRK